MAHISSDVVRKARLGLDRTVRAAESAYTRQASLQTYRALGEHAAAALAMGQGAVIDATMGDKEARAALRDGLGRAAGRLRYVECRAPEAEVKRRARAREADPSRESDATAAVAARLGAQWQALDEVPADDHLVLRTDRRVEEAVLDLTIWLDRHWT